jgi:hypothetical protein
MAVRAKFKLSEVHHYTYGTRKFIFRPEYDTSIPEDQRFAKASPSGEFTISVDNPAVFDKFEIGKQYYFDITPAE